MASDELVHIGKQDVITLATLFSLMGDPTRVRILLLLCGGEMNVTKLCTALSVPQPTVSHHLGLLRRGGLLQTRREGKSIHYALEKKLEYTHSHELVVRTTAGIKVRVGK